MKDLRQGNSKAVEMLLTYHEENESLRSAFSVIGEAGDVPLARSPTRNAGGSKATSVLTSPQLEAEFVLENNFVA